MGGVTGGAAAAVCSGVGVSGDGSSVDVDIVGDRDGGSSLSPVVATAPRRHLLRRR